MIFDKPEMPQTVQTAQHRIRSTMANRTRFYKSRDPTFLIHVLIIKGKSVFRGQFTHIRIQIEEIGQMFILSARVFEICYTYGIKLLSFPTVGQPYII